MEKSQENINDKLVNWLSGSLTFLTLVSSIFIIFLIMSWVSMS